METTQHNIKKKEKSPFANQYSLDTYYCTKCGKEWKSISNQQSQLINLNGCTK